MTLKRGIANTSIRKQARHLILVKGLSQLEASKIVGVSEQTMCAWNKKFKWNDQAEKSLKKKGGMTAVFDEFLDYVRSSKPSIHNDVKELLSNFLRKADNTRSKHG